MIEITERVIPNYDRKRILLEAIVNGKKLWRVWRENSATGTLEEKRKMLQRDIELAQKGIWPHEEND